jgi:hypothetical protein
VTLSLACGSYEVDSTGDFVEMLASGMRMVRISPESILIETTAGTRIRLRSATPILVTPEEPR